MSSGVETMCWYPLLMLLGVCCCLAGSEAARRDNEQQQERVVYVQQQPGGAATSTAHSIQCPACSFKQEIQAPPMAPGTQAHTQCQMCGQRIDISVSAPTISVSSPAGPPPMAVAVAVI